MHALSATLQELEELILRVFERSEERYARVTHVNMAFTQVGRKVDGEVARLNGRLDQLCAALEERVRVVLDARPIDAAARGKADEPRAVIARDADERPIINVVTGQRVRRLCKEGVKECSDVRD